MWCLLPRLQNTLDLYSKLIWCSNNFVKVSDCFKKVTSFIKLIQKAWISFDYQKNRSILSCHVVHNWKCFFHFFHIILQFSLLPLYTKEYLMIGMDFKWVNKCLPLIFWTLWICSEQVGLVLDITKFRITLYYAFICSVFSVKNLENALCLSERFIQNNWQINLNIQIHNIN